MRPWTILTGALLLTSAVVLLLNALSESLRNHSAEARTVMNQQNTITLSNANLVDVLAGSGLPVAAVEWEKDVLTLDLKISSASASPAEAYGLICKAIELTLDRTNNVNRLMLRIDGVDEWTGTRHLLIASDVRRGEVSPSTLQKLAAWKDPELPQELQSTLRAAVTPLWHYRFAGS
ncbi:hypothetical protein Q5741_01475 [Paenibacillus sp. JX-17]|uniref:Uncharacterized protein n=1 Tax=Paenibacillus lacisoli TaxID=3064525 RepID=A0ABT9CBM1_9BACL|nr:hypothetical protein [Paenibacillus sp. JX-17]MDO7905081.1 hypothetical protein [Paenibacillus sp. JX-17]